MLRHPSSFSCGDTFRKEARKGCTRRLSRLRLRGNAWILRWESFARRRTPLPQDDNGERKGIGQVRAPAPTWLGKSSHCFAKSRFLTAKADSELQVFESRLSSRRSSE